MSERSDEFKADLLDERRRAHIKNENSKTHSKRQDVVFSEVKAIVSSPDGKGALPVFYPPALKPKGLQKFGDGAPVVPPNVILDVKENMLRIAEHADPIGFLIAVAQGVPVPHFYVDQEGDDKENAAILQDYVVLDLKQRVEIMKFLAERIAPRLSVQTIHDSSKSDDPASWASITLRAAERATTEESDE